jgi:hypothetical protein
VSKGTTIGERWRWYRDTIILPGNRDIDPLELLGVELGFYAGAHAMLMLTADLASADDKIAVGRARIDGWFEELEGHSTDVHRALAEKERH